MSVVLLSSRVKLHNRLPLTMKSETEIQKRIEELESKAESIVEERGFGGPEEPDDPLARIQIKVEELEWVLEEKNKERPY